jgi:hypothetical protein
MIKKSKRTILKLIYLNEKKINNLGLRINGKNFFLIKSVYYLIFLKTFLCNKILGN